jgi:ABC-type glycerol-3-phosphate transport system permease component
MVRLKTLGADPVDPAAHAASAAAVIVNNLAARIPTETWSAPDATLLAAFTPMLADTAIDSALDNRLSRFELRGLIVRSLDAHMYTVADPAQIAKQWKVISGNAQILPGRDGTPYLKYQFDSSDSAPIVIKYDFDFPFDPSQLHKLTISTLTDDSWHKLIADLQVGSDHWTAREPGYLAQHRPGSFIFQPPTYEDASNKPHIWIGLKHNTIAPPPGTDPRHATLTLTLQPTSTLGAITAKIEHNYIRAVRYVPFWKYVANSVILVTLITVGTLFSSTFVAYAFARLRWPGRSVAFVILLSTMMLPSQVTMIPSFMIWRSVGWYNTLNPLWVPAFFGGAFFVFLMVQHMKTIPRELEEAARIDGLNAVQTWWYIIVPLVKPAAAAIAIMTIMGAWNEFMGPLIYLRDQSKFPLSLGLFGIRADAAAMTDWSLIMAGNVLMILPVIIMFVVFQKYFVQGMTMSGMKG